MKINLNNGLVEHHECYEEIELEVSKEQYEWFKNQTAGNRRFDMVEEEEPIRDKADLVWDIFWKLREVQHLSMEERMNVVLEQIEKEKNQNEPVELIRVPTKNKELYHIKGKSALGTYPEFKAVFQNTTFISEKVQE